MFKPRSRVFGLLPASRFAWAFLAIASIGGCETDTQASTLHHAVEVSRRKKDELCTVRAIIRDRRPEKGLYSFFNAEEPETGARPFVVQSNLPLLSDHEYVFRGRVVPWKGHPTTDLFLVEETVDRSYWPWFLGGLVLIAASLGAWRYIHHIRSFVDHNIKPPPPPAAEEVTVHRVMDSLFDKPIAESTFPSLVVEPGTPPTASKYSAFHLDYDEESPKKRWDDERQQECIVYGFGRQSDANDFVLNADYVSRRNHFRITVYDDKSAYLEVNPKAGTPVQITRPDNTVLPLAPNHPQRLENGYIVTIGDIKLRYSVPNRS